MESEDEHLPFGERSHGQRLVTYACIALGTGLISGLIFAEILSFEGETPLAAQRERALTAGKA